MNCEVNADQLSQYQSDRFPKKCLIRITLDCLQTILFSTEML